MSKGIITVWGKVSQLNFNLIDCRLAACYLYQIVIGAKWLIVVIDGSRGMHVIWARMLNQFHNLNLNPLQSRNRLALHSVYTEGVYIAIWIWLMGILIRFENLLRINCTWSVPALSSFQQSNCPIDYRLTILGIEFDFRFRFEFGFGMWNVKWGWKGNVKSHVENLACGKCGLRFLVGEDLGQSPERDACYAVDCNKLGQVRHKTIGSPKKRKKSAAVARRAESLEKVMSSTD